MDGQIVSTQLNYESLYSNPFWAIMDFRFQSQEEINNANALQE